MIPLGRLVTIQRMAPTYDTSADAHLAPHGVGGTVRLYWHDEELGFQNCRALVTAEGDDFARDLEPEDAALGALSGVPRGTAGVARPYWRPMGNNEPRLQPKE